MIDIIAFADRANFAVEARNPMLEVFAAYPVAKYWAAAAAAAAANPTVVATVQAVIEPEASFAAVEPVAVIAALEKVTNLMHFVVIVAALEPLIAVLVANEKNAG